MNTIASSPAKCEIRIFLFCIIVVPSGFYFENGDRKTMHLRCSYSDTKKDSWALANRSFIHSTKTRSCTVASLVVHVERTQNVPSCQFSARESREAQNVTWRHYS